MTHLVKQNHNEPNFEGLNSMLDWLQSILLMDGNSKDSTWQDAIREIINFQDEDHSFKLIDSYQIESDCRFEYCKYPHHLATAILMRAMLENRNMFSKAEEKILLRAMVESYRIGFYGHGYEGYEGVLRCIKTYQLGGVHEFFRRYPAFCPEFFVMFSETIEVVQSLCIHQDFGSGWSGNYKKDIQQITDRSVKNTIFVYGTLLSGQANHDMYLAESGKPVKATVSGYTMYDAGFFPGIVRGDGKVKGELYHVDDFTLKTLDHLEGEGKLFTRKFTLATSESGDKEPALVYVYNGDTNHLTKIPYELQPYKAKH